VLQLLSASFLAFLFAAVAFAHELCYNFLANVLEVAKFDLRENFSLSPVDFDQFAHVSGINID